MRRFLLAAVLAGLCLGATVDPARKRVGDYEVLLRLPSDGLVAREEMEIELRIQDATRPDPLTGFAPIIRANVDVVIDMPQMPGMPAYRETAHAEGVPGEYGVHPTFAHGGEYRLRMTVQPPQSAAFTAEFPLVVGDSSDGKRARKPSRYALELTSKPKKPKAGEPAELRFVFRDRENPREIYRSFETVHEALFHLILVRTDLAEFAHEHPVSEPDGSFKLTHTFASAGEYHLFADVAPLGAGSQVMMSRVSVTGKAIESKVGVHESDVDMALLPAGDIQPVKRTTTLLVAIRDRHTGSAIAELQSYLGAPGHFILIHEDAETFVHSHPREEVGSVVDGQLRFLARFPKAGIYKGWVQVKRNGEIITQEFRLRAE